MGSLGGKSPFFQSDEIDVVTQHFTFQSTLDRDKYENLYQVFEITSRQTD